MTDYEYIMVQCRKNHSTVWDEKELRECQSILRNLTREELVSVYRSRLLPSTFLLSATYCGYSLRFVRSVMLRYQMKRKGLALVKTTN